MSTPIGPYRRYQELGGTTSSSAPSHYDEWASAVDRERSRQMREDGRLPSPFRPGSVPWVLFTGLRVAWFVLRHAWVTVLWIAAIMLFGTFGSVLAVLSIIAWFACLLAQSQVSAPWIRAGLYAAPVLGDGYRLIRSLRRRRQIAEGNALLREMQMVSATDERVYDAYLDHETGIFYFDVPLAGATEEKVAEKVELGLPVVGMADFTLHRMSNSAWEVEFFPEVRKTALDEPRSIIAPPEVDWEKMAVYAFYDEHGKPQALSLSGTSGTIVGGVPGGGKTAFINEFLTPLLADDRVKITVCDGKGGADFDSVGPYVDLLWQDDEDFDGMIELLESKQQVMRDRIKTNKHLTGESNYWRSPIVPERPVELIVVDECQSWLEQTGRPKAEKEKMTRIEALIRDLIKRGRSAGMHLILSTQKPDASTINTGIRDLCGRRISFRVTTPEMATMVLGATPEDAVSPTEIPADRIGGCVIGSDSGELIQARAYYMPEKAIETYLAEHGTPKEGNRPGESCGDAEELEVNDLE